jgi:4'-phosphopantetheinyl transferase EntD
MPPHQLLSRLLPPGLRSAGLSLQDVDVAALPEALVGMERSSLRRQRELVGGRQLLQSLQQELGGEGRVLGRGPDRAPRWPPGLCGSVTHAWSGSGEGWAMAVMGASTSWAGLGVDLEPDEPLPEDVGDFIGAPGDALPSGLPDRLLFSAKEAIYKAISAEVGRVLEFWEVAVQVQGDQLQAGLRYPVGRLAAGPQWRGRWAAGGGWMVTTFFRNRGE